MRDKRRHKRKKVQRAYLDRQLYKTERCIEKFNQKAHTLRQVIKVMDDREAKSKKEKQDAVNKALHVAAIESVPTEKGGTKNASST